MNNLLHTTMLSKERIEIDRLKAVKMFIGYEERLKKDLQGIVELASEICSVPIALISLVDEKIQYVNASVGADIKELPTETSFCTHAVKQEDVMLVEDATKDERFKHFPLVAGAPNIMFYGSANLKSNEGHNVGTLCVYDLQPRHLNQIQTAALQKLADQVSRLMELDFSLKLIERKVSESTEQKTEIDRINLKLRAVLDSSSYVQILLDENFEILAINKYAKTLFRNVDRNMVGNYNISQLKNSIRINEFTEDFRKALSGTVVSKEILVNNLITNEDIWWDITYNPARDVDGNIIGVSITGLDINYKKISHDKIAEQNEKLQEIAQIQSHEYRGPLSAIIGLMSLITEDDFVAKREYLELMGTAVSQLDKQITAVVTKANEL